MIYGYARVSTAAQDETGQVRQLKAAGCEKVFREKITGTTADRPERYQSWYVLGNSVAHGPGWSLPWFIATCSTAGPSETAGK